MTLYPTGDALDVQLATEHTATVLQDVADERVRQVEKWGVQTHPDGTDASYVTEADEARDACDFHDAMGNVTWLDILTEEFYEAASETDPDKLRTELIQVAAVALSWAEDLDVKAGE